MTEMKNNAHTMGLFRNFLWYDTIGTDTISMITHSFYSCNFNAHEQDRMYHKAYSKPVYLYIRFMRYRKKVTILLYFTYIFNFLGKTLISKVLSSGVYDAVDNILPTLLSFPATVEYRVFLQLCEAFSCYEGSFIQ